MERLQSIRGFRVVFITVFLALLGCEAPNQSHTSLSPGYVQLDQNNPKDKEFFLALKNSLKNLGTLIAVYADSTEVSLYREGKRPYPTNYHYTIKANSKVSLEGLKQANLSLQ